MLTVGIDSGTKTTGLALILHGLLGDYLIFGAELFHRTDIKEKLQKRKAVRRGRRSRKCRYRAPRFDHRRNREGKLPPSLQSKVNNVVCWVKRFQRYCPLAEVRLETAKFDTQLLQNPDIQGVGYQQGPLYGYQNAREYLKQLFECRCGYCGTEGSRDNPFEIDHIVPKSCGGTDTISNLILSCRKCNQAKSNRLLEEFVTDPVKLKQIRQRQKQNLQATGQVNSLRKKLVEMLGVIAGKSTMLLVIGYGYQTQANRKFLSLPKAHWIDAAVCTVAGQTVQVNPELVQLTIKAVGRGCRQMCKMDKYGFPRTKPKLRQKRHFGFQTGDIVVTKVSKGRKIPNGRYVGRVVVRKSGNFDIQVSFGKVSASHKSCSLLHSADGYFYI